MNPRTSAGRDEDGAWHLLLVRNPGDRTSVIPGGCTHEPPRGRFVAKAMHRVTNADDLERVQSESVCFVFRVDTLNAERGCECGQRAQRRRGQFRVGREVCVNLPILFIIEETAEFGVAADGGVKERAQA